MKSVVNAYGRSPTTAFLESAQIRVWQDVPVTIKCISQQILLSGLSGRKAPSSMGKVRTAEVLRLRAASAVSRDKSVRRSAQDDDFVGGAVFKKRKGVGPLVAFFRTSSDLSAFIGKHGLGSCRIW
jgi:hypothetical protein